MMWKYNQEDKGVKHIMKTVNVKSEMFKYQIL